MRGNQVLSNITERHEEDTEAVLIESLEHKPNIRNICFKRVHRKTHKNPDGHGGAKGRPMAAKFTVVKDRERVRKWGKKAKRYISRHTRTIHIRNRRNGNQHKATLVKDKLYVDGKEVPVTSNKTAGAECTATSSEIIGSASLTGTLMETTLPASQGNLYFELFSNNNIRDL